ncbi:flagellin-specific chaperone FliS [Clostridium saccharoperbutylacetonicum]|nr:flagellin-specific chaperone FliS [Clostridium saccharoperbutylacetonicum]
MYPNAYNVYKSNSVNYASKEQLLLMLVEGAVKFAKI